MAWEVYVGQKAPGLGQVIAKKQMMPHHDDKIRFSGNSGELVLINIADEPWFVIAMWLYGEDEPSPAISKRLGLDFAYREWKELTENM